ncbi:hypothetical protein Nepgr_029465 [Nepenthes gracilis]|uniref:Glycosyltransferase n=1 Tax=Nepenthes gracilis TaxID=150966 RepID=A0AAD3TE09_NEPGR|nr:hypothetical protein Nepgr_029465 [Nepenthes gracilis]
MSYETRVPLHVVVLPYPSQGHINPLLQFAKRLVSKGVKATIATTYSTASSVHSTNVAVEPISDGFDGSILAGKEDSFLSSFKENGSRDLSQLLEKYRNSGNPVSCIVYDAFLPWALEVAKQHGIYGAAFFTNSATVCAIFCCVCRGLLSLPLKAEDVRLALPELPEFRFCDLPSFLRRPESYPAYLNMKMAQFSNLEKADWVFCNSFQELESEVTEGISDKWPAKLIGPVVPSFYLDARIKEDKGYGASLWKPLDDKCSSWLETKPPKSVIYISFGSMVSLSPKQTAEIAWALGESHYYFLWVVRDSQLTLLPEKFTDSFNDEKGIIVPWCNQLELLAHPAVGCFVTHCGWNSTLEGLSLGVPMVGVPQWTDQLPDAKFIEEVWGVGVRAKEDDDGVVRKAEFLSCLEEVMAGRRSEEIKKNAAKWRDSAKEAVSEGGSSDTKINDFLEQLSIASGTITARVSLG